MSCTMREESGYLLLSPRGDLSLTTLASVRPVLDKLLLDHGRVVADLSQLHLLWPPAIQVFAASLAAAGGWPGARLVLASPTPAVRAALHRTRVDVNILVADQVADAVLLLQTRPPRVSASRELPLSAQAPRWARSLLDTKRLDWASTPPTELAWEDATLIASELVTNAVEHARTTSTIHVALDRLGVHIAVRDHRPGGVARPGRPVPGPALSPTPTLRGHGLVLVEQLSRSWGVTAHDDGKTVWAIIDTSSGETP